MEIILVLVFGTAIISWYRFFYEALKEAQVLEIENEFTQSPALAGFVFFCFSLILSPVLFIPTIVPSMGMAVQSGMRSVICGQREF